MPLSFPSLQSWTEPAAKHLVQATKVDFGQQEPFFATLGRDPRRDLLSLPVLFLVHCLFSCVIVMLDLKPFCSWLLCLQKEEPGSRTGDWMWGFWGRALASVPLQQTSELGFLLITGGCCIFGTKAPSVAGLASEVFPGAPRLYPTCPVPPALRSRSSESS